MPRVGNHKRYLSPNSSLDRKIMVHKKITRRKGNYILEETIGEGAFAKVKLGTHIHTGEKVAIKILNKEKLFEEALEDNLANGIEGCDIQKIRKEINILKRLRHKNVIQLYEIMESKTNLYIVMEYCEGKELFDYIVRNKFLSEKEACRFFQQIIDGVEYLHLSNITHRDLKPENLLLDNKKRIRISDFGLSNMSDKIDSLLETPCGTPSYAPPEMLRGERYNGVYSDIWSCGIILYTMLVGNLPCAESKEDLIYENIMTHNYYYPEYVSDEAIDLIENMLKVDPSERYDFEQIKSHPWFNLIEPKLKPGIVYGVHKVPIDEKILNKVEEFGYDKSKCLKSLENYSYDSNSSIYYLTLKQFTRENKASISDLFSNKYLNYLKNYKNWLKPEEINNPLFMNYEVEMPFEIEQEKAKNYISNALLAYNDKNNKNRNIRNFEAIPEEETKNNKSFDISINNTNYIDTDNPLSTKSKKVNANKRVFNNEIEKYKKEDDVKSDLPISKSKKEKSNNTKNKNKNKTERKNNANTSNINSSIVTNINKKKLGKKSSGNDNNSSAKKLDNYKLYSKIKTPNKKNKIKKNISHGDISNYEKDKNNLSNINIQDIIKKRVRNKKQSVEQSNKIEGKKEKPKLSNLSNSKNKRDSKNINNIENNNEINDINKTTKKNENEVVKNKISEKTENKNENKTENKTENKNENKNEKKTENKSDVNKKIDNKSMKQINKENINILIGVNHEENNNINKKKKKSQNNNNNKNNNINKINTNASNNINNNKINNININNNSQNNINQNNNNNNNSNIDNYSTNIKVNEKEIIHKKSNNINNNDNIDKNNLSNISKESKIVLKESLSKFSNISKNDNQEENNEHEPKVIIQQINENENKNNNNQCDANINNKAIQDQISNLDKTVLSDSSSMSRTVLSPKAFSDINHENNIRLNFNTNNRSSFSKRVEYSNTKARKKIKSKFNKKIGEEEKKIELSTDSMSSIEKMKLIQKLEKDEERLNNEINFINNITSDTTLASINSNNKDANENSSNMLHLMAKKMLKNSIFNKYLINNKKPKKPIKEDIEDKFYTLQKYKNIIGMIEHLKNKIFKKKYTDFNYETFDEYLNDEDDKLFNQSLLKTMGINRFIKNARECLYKKEKLNKRSQSKAYGLNSFKFNNVFQANQKPTRFVTTKKLDYYNLNNLNNKLNFGYYRPKRNLNLSYLSSTTNSKSTIKNKRAKLNYTTTNNDSVGSITYNIKPVNKKKRFFSSEQTTEYYPEKSSSIPKKIRINIKTFKFNKKSNEPLNLNNNILKKIRERITNNYTSIINKYNNNTTKSKNKKYISKIKNKSLNYDSDYNDRKRRIRNMSSCSMNNIYESEESFSSNYNSSVDKDKINKNITVNYDSNHKKEEIKDEENGIYKKNKNITTPELGSKFNNKFTKNDSHKYDNDNEDDNFSDNVPILVNLTNIGNITGGTCTKRSQKDNLTQRDKIHINFNDINDKKKTIKSNYNRGNQKLLYNTIFSPKSNNSKKNNIITYLHKNKLNFAGKKKDIGLKDTEKLNKEIWGKKNKNNRSVLDINKIDINNVDNEKSKNYKNSNVTNAECQLSIDDNDSKNLNRTTINIFKKNNKEGLRDIKENSPIDLNSLLTLTYNDIKSRAKIYFKKIGFFYNEKDNIIKATRGGTIIEITLYKIDNESNNIYCNTRIKTNDLRKEKEIVRKLFVFLNKKE